MISFFSRENEERVGQKVEEKREISLTRSCRNLSA